MPYPEVVVALGDENENQIGIAGNPLYVQGTVTATSTNPVVTSATGIGAILLSYSPGAAFWLEGVTLHLTLKTSASGWTLTTGLPTTRYYCPRICPQDRLPTCYGNQTARYLANLETPSLLHGPTRRAGYTAFAS